MRVIKRLKNRFSKLSWMLTLLASLFVVYYFINISLGKVKVTRQESQQPFRSEATKRIEDASSISETKIRMKHILLWTSASTSPFIYFGTGNSVFVNKTCKWTNCYVTNDRNYLGDYTEFEVIAFNGPELLEYLSFGNIPIRRSLHQKYVYANIEASSNYPLCSDTWNGFFNWTWTYKLNSDAVWSYFVVRNASSHVIGPNENMTWLRLEEMDDIDKELKKKLKTKSKPAAWYSSNCMTQSNRDIYVRELRRHLQKFNMDVHVYGECGEFSCPKEQMNYCNDMLEKDYYFYLAFENAISEDYVTEKIVTALNHNTVPIVFGGANYSRFMPDGIYLNAFNMTTQLLAAKMYQIIKNSTSYYNFFKWKKYYSYHQKHESPDTDDYCKFCAILNNEHLMNKTTVYNHLNEWWTGSDKRKICQPGTNTIQTRK